MEHDTKVTLHLCEQCAQQMGVETGGAILKSPLGGFITAMGKGAAVLPAAADGLRCGECGGTLRDFRETGRLGCAHCYQAFEPHLRDLLRRLHGSSQHVGERYDIPGERDADPRRRLLDLRDQLRRAALVGAVGEHRALFRRFAGYPVGPSALLGLPAGRETWEDLLALVVDEPSVDRP